MKRYPSAADPRDGLGACPLGNPTSEVWWSAELEGGWREEVPGARSKCSVKSASDSLERDLVDTVGSALGSVWLILPAWMVVVSIGGFIPAWVHEGSWDMDPTMLLMWILQLGMSALTIVGLLPVVFHWWFLRSMLEGQEVVWNLWRSFVTQVLTGSVFLGMYKYGEFETRMASLAAVMAVVAAVVSQVRVLLRRRWERDFGD